MIETVQRKHTDYHMWGSFSMHSSLHFSVLLTYSTTANCKLIQRSNTLPPQHWKALRPGRLIHSICTSTSPRSTFLNRRHMSWNILPLFQMMQLSSARQFSLFGWTLSTLVPLGRFCNPIFMHSMYGLMSITASPILSSSVNVSLSYTVCKTRMKRMCN